MGNPVSLFDPTGLVAISIREYTDKYGGTVTWNEKTGIATFEISGIKITTTVSGFNTNGLYITNVNGRMTADDSALNAFFGQALTWNEPKKSNSGNIVKSGLALAGGVALVDSPLPGPADVAGGIIAVGTLIVGGAVLISDTVTESSAKGKYGDQTVKDVLKTKRGSIKNAPLPPGGPNWNDLIRNGVTMEAIRRLADMGETGYKEIWKLLNEIRFNK